MAPYRHPADRAGRRARLIRGVGPKAYTCCYRVLREVIARHGARCKAGYPTRSNGKPLFRFSSQLYKLRCRIETAMLQQRLQALRHPLRWAARDHLAFVCYAADLMTSRWCAARELRCPVRFTPTAGEKGRCSASRRIDRRIASWGTRPVRPTTCARPTPKVRSQSSPTTRHAPLNIRSTSTDGQRDQVECCVKAKTVTCFWSRLDALHEGGDKAIGGKVILREPIVGDAPEVLQSVERTLDAPRQHIKVLAEAEWLLSVAAVLGMTGLVPRASSLSRNRHYHRRCDENAIRRLNSTDKPLRDRSIVGFATGH